MTKYKYSRFTTSTKKDKIESNEDPSSNLAIIIAAAGQGTRTKPTYPKCLFNINGQTLLSRQIEIFSRVYPTAEIIVVGGFRHSDIEAEIANQARLVLNEKFDETGVVHSIGLALRATLKHNIIISYGDLVFNDNCIKGIVSTESSLLLDIQSNFKKDDIGVSLKENYIDSFSYSLPLKWGQICYIYGDIYEQFKSTMTDINHNQSMLHELLPLFHFKARFSNKFLVKNITYRDDVEEIRKKL